MRTAIDELTAKAKAARAASRPLARLSTAVKNEALLNIAQALESQQKTILAANKKDMVAGRSSGTSEAMLDRLLLNPQRLNALAADVRNVAALPDPVGEAFDARTLPNGLQVERRRVPLGVIGAIYESRPNVTVDISVLCLKSGNAVVLRGGSEAVHTNSALAALVRKAIAKAGVPEEAVQFIESTDRSLVDRMLKMREYIDLIIPRGGAELIKHVAQNAAMPAITGGIGVCHVYVDSAADATKAVEIVYNSKVQRPTVCNALDTIIIHSKVASSQLPAIAEKLAGAGVELRCDRRALTILGPRKGLKLKPAAREDWDTEYLSLTAGVRVVDSLDEALEHIQKHGSGHTESIVTEDYSAAMRFLDEVDAAVVLVNASTRFNDGAQLGLGTEVAISTNKFHARGPMGLRELTSYKWRVMGTGQVRE